MIERSRTLFVGFIAFVLVLVTFSSFQKNKKTEGFGSVTLKMIYNGGLSMNIAITGALFTLRVQYEYAQIQCKEGAGDANDLRKASHKCSILPRPNCQNSPHVNGNMPLKLGRTFFV